MCEKVEMVATENQSDIAGAREIKMCIAEITFFEYAHVKIKSVNNILFAR